MRLIHYYSDNRFPYTYVELRVFYIGTQLFYTHTSPEYSRYHDSVKGRWRIKYKEVNGKTIDSGFWCEGQGLKQMEDGSQYEKQK